MCFVWKQGGLKCQVKISLSKHTGWCLWNYHICLCVFKGYLRNIAVNVFFWWVICDHLVPLFFLLVLVLVRKIWIWSFFSVLIKLLLMNYKLVKCVIAWFPSQLVMPFPISRLRLYSLLLSILFLAFCWWCWWFLCSCSTTLKAGLIWWGSWKQFRKLVFLFIWGLVRMPVRNGIMGLLWFQFLFLISSFSSFLLFVCFPVHCVKKKSQILKSCWCNISIYHVFYILISSFKFMVRQCYNISSSVKRTSSCYGPLQISAPRLFRNSLPSLQSHVFKLFCVLMIGDSHFGYISFLGFSFEQQMTYSRYVMILMVAMFGTSTSTFFIY